MKSKLTMLCSVAAVCAGPFSVGGSAFAQGVRLERRSMMQPVRRLGLLPVVHNTFDARKNLSDQTSLRGLLAQPLSADEFAQKFNSVLKSVADTSGRFWTMDVIPSETTAGKAPSAAEMSSFQRAQLVKEYDLDVWLRADIYFTADHTAVRVTMTGPQLKPTIAREDILLPFGADWNAIATAYAQAIGRMSETIGHDGRVVFENADMFGIDFGTERGLTPGQRLKAGLVVQSAAHPQTGEVLRYQRVALFELEVVDTKQGASLCRKLTVDQELLRQAEATYGSGTDRKFTLLVWRDGNEPSASTGVTAWKPNVTAQPRAESEPSGFTPRETLSQPAVTSAGPTSPGVSAGRLNSAAETREPARVPAPAPVAMVGQDSLFFPSVKRGSGGPASGIKFAASASEGTVELSKGPVSSELPGYILNTFSLQDGFRYMEDWNVRYGAEYAMFSGKLDGSRMTFKASAVAPASTLQIPELPMNWGAEAQYSTGTARTEKSKKTFDAFELFGVLSTQRALDGGWGLGVEYKQSMTGLLAGAFAFETAIDVSPGAPLPKELGAQWRYINDGDRWTEWMLGLTWKLGSGE